MNLLTPLKGNAMSLRITSPKRDGFWYLLALVVSVAAGASTYELSQANSVGLVNIIAITAGTLLGFLIMSLSILLAISDNRMVKKLRDDGKISNLVSQIFIGSLVFTLAIALSIAYLITFNVTLSAAVSALMFFGLIIFCRVGYKYMILFEMMD